MTRSASQVERLACLELRGGNQLTTYGARLSVLTAWVTCNPLRPSQRDGDLYYLSACSRGSSARAGLACLLSMARSLPVNSPTAAGKALLVAVGRFRGSAPAKDDATVVTLRCVGAA